VLKLLIRASTAMSLAIASVAIVLPSSVDAAHASRSSILSKICGGSTMKITCAPGSAQCTQTVLSLTTVDSMKVSPAKPKGLDEYTAIGLQCTKSKDGDAYFYVQYGERPRGCAFCEWFAIYDAHGKLLTNNDPPILRDATMPPAQQMSPNNNEFQAVSDKLGLQKVDMDLIQ
jgi:hypothetical protein